MSLKMWLKDYYKVLIFCIIYTILMTIVVIVADLIYVCITTGIVIVCVVIHSKTLEHRIKKKK